MLAPRTGQQRLSDPPPMPDRDPAPLARALGRIPTGLYVVSGLLDGRPVGFVGSFLVQTGFAPPTVCVAIAKGRPHLEALRQARVFAVSILDAESRGLMKSFFRKLAPGEGAFDAVEHRNAPSGCPVLPQALAWLDCRVTGEHATADHVVVFGEVLEGALVREGEPAVHLRRNGLDY